MTTTDETTTDQTDETTEPTANSEAAKYRRKLREAEAERDRLADTVGRLQRAEAERIAASTLQRPGDMFDAGTDLADLLDDVGNVDPDKVTAAADTIANERPHWRVPPSPPAESRARESLRPAVGNPEDDDRQDSFTAAFAPR